MTNMSAIEPSAPPDYFTHNSTIHEGHETMATIYKKSEMESNSDTQSPRKQEVTPIAVDVIPFYKRSKDMYGMGFKKKKKPYGNCQNQLYKMESSFEVPGYENLAKFQEQQRQIATELEQNLHFDGSKSKSVDPPSHCRHEYHLDDVDNVAKYDNQPCPHSSQFNPNTASTPNRLFSGKFFETITM